MIIHQEKILERITEILDYFEVEYKTSSNRIIFACPIHESSRSTSATIYTGSGIWKCWTNHCEEKVGKGIFQLVYGLLDKYSTKRHSKEEVIHWLEKLLNSKLSDEETEENTAKRRSVNMSYAFSQREQKETPQITREIVKSNLSIPAGYFIGRNYLADTLKRYDVGLCNTPRKQMYGRVVVPIYDDEYAFMLGCSGRTLKPQCPLCNKFHLKTESCPNSPFGEISASKWIHSLGFQAEKHFYNFWFARVAIEESKTAILVEGPADVWRLEEAGIHIGLGLFGARLTDSQVEKLEKLDLMNIVVATDSDEAGQEARRKIVDRLWRTYNLTEISLPSKDVGELSIEQTKEIFKKYVK